MKTQVMNRHILVLFLVSVLMMAAGWYPPFVSQPMLSQTQIPLHIADHPSGILQYTGHALPGKAYVT